MLTLTFFSFPGFSLFCNGIIFIILTKHSVIKTFQTNFFIFTIHLTWNNSDFLVSLNKSLSLTSQFITWLSFDIIKENKKINVANFLSYREKNNAQKTREKKVE